jgi:hypothetical protein
LYNLKNTKNINDISLLDRNGNATQIKFSNGINAIFIPNPLHPPGAVNNSPQGAITSKDCRKTKFPANIHVVHSPVAENQRPKELSSGQSEKGKPQGRKSQGIGEMVKWKIGCQRVSREKVFQKNSG